MTVSRRAQRLCASHSSGVSSRNCWKYYKTLHNAERTALDLPWPQRFVEWLTWGCVGFYSGCWGSARLVLGRAFAMPRGSRVSIKNQGSRISPSWCRSLTWKTSRICKWSVLAEKWTGRPAPASHMREKKKDARACVCECVWVDSSIRRGPK